MVVEKYLYKKLEGKERGKEKKRRASENILSLSRAQNISFTVFCQELSLTIMNLKI